MKPNAIVYTSGTGFTRRYAELLSCETGLKVCSLEEAKCLPAGEQILYLGWICASQVKGFKQAAKRFAICAVCGVGLCPGGGRIPEVRKATALPEEVPLFTLQGGMDRSKLKGIHKLMISMLTKGLSGQAQRKPEDEEMLGLLTTDKSYVTQENLEPVLAWYREQEN